MQVLPADSDGMRGSGSGSARAVRRTPDALRFDLARRFENDAQEGGWVVTVGKGFVFSPVGKRAL